jgi:putative heme-binding domain-containing protein
LWTELGRLLGAAASAPTTASTREPLIIDIVGTGPAPIAKGQVDREFLRSAALLSGFGESARSRGVAGADTAGVLFALVRQAAGQSPEAKPANGAPVVSAAEERLKALFAQALTLAVDRAADEPTRRLALSLLSHADYATAGDRLLVLVDPTEPTTVQSGAARALGLMKSPRIATTLLEPERFRGYTPRLREEVIGAVLANSQHLPGLIEALETGAVPANAIDSLRRRQLTEHRDPELRARAQKVYAAATPGNRLTIYEELKTVVSLDANPAQGKQVFKRVCASCHRLDRDGSPVGPDLFGIRNQPKEAILLHIVIPEQEITQGFAAYVVATHDGRVLTGLLAAETPTSVTLRQALGKEDTILRSDIERIAASQLSLMPQELEKQLNRQDFADLLAYLKGQ